MKYILCLYLVIMFTSCDGEIRLDKMKTEHLTFEKLPDTIKSIYLKSLFKLSGECTECYNGPDLICLDNQNCKKSINPECGRPTSACIETLMIDGFKFKLIDGYGKYDSP